MRQDEGIPEDSPGQQLPDQPAEEDMMLYRSRMLGLWLLAVSATACGSLPKYPGDRSAAHELFLQATDEISSGRTGPALDTLRHDYPDSPWTTKAQNFVKLNKAQETLEIKVQTLQLEKSHLLQENRKLKEDLDQLRKLVIETERRRK
jgi:hypothetical protein